MVPVALVEAQHYIAINGEIDTAMNLPKLGGDSVYLVNESLTIQNGGELRVEAGVRIYFGHSAYLRVDGGNLILDGQRNDSISLLCYEFSHDWAGIQLKNINEDDSVRIAYVEVIGALSAINASTSQNVSIRHCSFHNYYAGKGIELIDCNNVLVDNCFFLQCISGIELKARSADSEDNVFSNNIFDQGQINIELSNVGYGFKCNRNRIISNCFQGAASAISFETTGGISDKDATNYIEGNLISSQLPEGSAGYSSYGLKVATDSVIIRNNVFWGNDEAIRMMRASHLVIENNTFYENGFTISNLVTSGSMRFLGNTISEAKRRIVNFPSNKSHMNRNHFLHYNKNTILFSNIASDDIDLRGNYWDANTEAEIDAVIFDKHDSHVLGEIIYDNRLPHCDTTNPIAPPFMVKKQYVNNKWLVSWDENLEQDVDHYVLFYGDFNYYKFAHCIDGITGNSYILTAQQAENVAVVACDRAYNPDVYASVGQSAYAFATVYPYAGVDDDFCENSQTGYPIRESNIPYIYNSFVWRSSGSGVFSDSLSLRPVYYPSKTDYETGEVTLTIWVTSNGTTKTDALILKLYKSLNMNAGEDSFSGLDRPLQITQAEAYNYDSLRWTSLGDGHFENPTILDATYHLGNEDKASGFVDMVLEAWSQCGFASDTVRFHLFKDHSLEGHIWKNGRPESNTQVIAVAMGETNQFASGFYRTTSNEEGFFKFDGLLPDTYVLYACPDTIGMGTAGCYYYGDLQWDESNMILVDGNVSGLDMELPEVVTAFHSGQGRIIGVFDYPESPFRARDFYCKPWLRDNSLTYCNDGLSNVGVLLLNATKQRILGFALTDNEGCFRFTNLPYGTYHVMADLPRFGRGMCEEIRISPEQPVVNNIHLFINTEGKMAMSYQKNNPASTDLYAYPNPADTDITLTGLKANTYYNVLVFDCFGQSLINKNFLLTTNVLGETTIQTEGLKSGLYFIQAKDGSGAVLTTKFIKQ